MLRQEDNEPPKPEKPTVHRNMSQPNLAPAQIASQPDRIKPIYVARNIITKYAFATRVGYIPGNPSKVNQDSIILCPSFEQLPGLNHRHFFGVCDGHGSNGHHASSSIKEKLPLLVKLGLTN